MTFAPNAPAPSATYARTSAVSASLRDLDSLADRIAAGRDALRAKEGVFTDETIAEKLVAFSASQVSVLHAQAGSAGRVIASAYRSIVDAGRAAVEADAASWDHGRLATMRLELEARFSVPPEPFSHRSLADEHLDAMREALASQDRHLLRELHRVVTVNTDWQATSVPQVREMLGKVADAIAVPEQRESVEQLEALAADVRKLAGSMYQLESDLSAGEWRNGRSLGTGVFVALEPSPVAVRLGDVVRVEGAAPNAFQSLAEMAA